MGMFPKYFLSIGAYLNCIFLTLVQNRPCNVHRSFGFFPCFFFAYRANDRMTGVTPIVAVTFSFFACWYTSSNLFSQSFLVIPDPRLSMSRSEEHTSELQSR